MNRFDPQVNWRGKSAGIGHRYHCWSKLYFN